MGFRFRKSKSFGPLKVNISKKGVGWSVGTNGVRYTKRTDGKKQTTLSIPGTGISYVDIKGNCKKDGGCKNINDNYAANSQTYISENRKSQIPFYKKTWFMWLTLFLFPPIGITLLWFFSNYNKKLKISLSIFFGIIFIIALSTPNDKSNLNNSTSSTTVNSQNAIHDKTLQESKVEETAKLIGWQNIDGKYYFYDDLGNKKTGWVNEHDKYYYCDKTGTMQTGWIEDNGNWYYLNADGTMAKDIRKDGYSINSSGVATKEVVQTPKNNTQSNSSTTSNNSVQSSNSVGSTIYIASSGKGKKYHSNPNCSKMKGTISLTKDKAESKGYTPCSKCH